MMQSANLSLHMLKKQFRQGNSTITVLDDLSCNFDQNQTYAITGVSGTGKSTLINLLAGLEEPTSGQVRFNKKDLASLSQAERGHFLNHNIGLVFQQPHLIRELTVRENIMVPGMIANKDRAFCKKRADELLAAVGIGEKAESKPSALSGGQQQRVALARALFNEPVFLLADEPTGNVDIQTGKKIVSLLLKLQKQYNMGIIVSTHDAYVAESMQQRYELQNGKLNLL